MEPPKTLSEHDFNTDVTRVLTSFIEQDDINVVLIGEGGSGKTTIINNVLNDYFRGFEATSNIMHINILNEHGNTFFRNNLTVFCQVNTCIPTRKKVVRIDNLEMISEQNQHVIRGLYDKYRHNVHFICIANTCTHIIEQLQSRLFLVKLNLPTSKIMSQILARSTNHKYNREITEYIMKCSKQNVSRMLSFVKKLQLCETEPTMETVKLLCDGISPHVFANYTRLCTEGNTKEAVSILLRIYDDGYSSIDIFDEYYNFIRNDTTFSREISFKIIKILSKYTQMFYDTYEHKITMIFFTNDLVNACLKKQK